MTYIIGRSNTVSYLQSMKRSEDIVLIKEEIIKQCIVKQQSLISDFNARLEDLKQTQHFEMEKNEWEDTGRSSFSELNILREALEFAKEEMRILNFIKSNPKRVHITPDLGAVVVTDKETFFVSVSIEEFFAEGKRYFGISTKSPIYHAMYKKVVFESFSNAGIDYFIKEIF